MKYLSTINSSFQDQYIKVRTIEQRVYSDTTVLKFPFLPKEHEQFKEWKIRQENAFRFIDYLKNKEIEHCLEIGCGNGWFSNLIATSISAQVIGLDINEPELNQANRLFKKSNLQFCYGNIFESSFASKFDIIVFNASVHYFKDLIALMDCLKQLLKPNGEIHILDTMFYSNENDRKAAKERTKLYYKNLDTTKMANFYFHHKTSDLIEFHLMTNTKSRLLSYFGIKSTFFPWYRFRK